MSPLVKKEIRLLLPAWIVAMVLAIFTPPIPGTWLLGTSGTPFGFILGLLLLGIASFGQEFSSGSFSALLSHPMERRQIWNVKTRMLFYAFALVFAGWVVHNVFVREYLFPNFYAQVYYFPARPDVEPLVQVRYLLLALAIFTGSLWSTLLVRQIIAAFGLTLLAPLAAVFWVGIIAEHYNWTIRVCDNVIDGVLAAYSVAGFLWARRLFLHAQDTQWTGGDFSFPWRARISGQNMALISKPPRHWLGALAWKEILLHQANLLIAALILTLHLSSVVIRKIHPQFRDPDVNFILGSVWTLWLLMPLLVGSAAVAEERKLGVIESQLCLPVSRRFQLFVKFFISLLLSLFLGVAVPSLIEGLGLSTVPVFLIAALIFVISFYSSSLARTTLQAMGLAMLIFTLLYFYESGMTIRLFSYGQTSPAPQIGLIYLARFLSLPVLLAVSASLAYWNFKWLHQNRKLWTRNLIVLFIGLVFISASSRSIYFRAWEWVMPVDRAHGPARLTASALPTFSAAGGDRVSFVLPDGRLWVAQVRPYDVDDHGSMHYFPVYQKFLDGSNWMSAAWSLGSLAAIKSDGTLWSFTNNPDDFARVGSDTNWLRAAGALWSSGFLLLKDNGTIWYWGAVDYPPTNFPVPIHISNGTNFMDVFVSSERGPIAKKNDGSLWALSFKNNKTNSMPHLFRIREPLDINGRIQSFNGYIELSTNGDLSFGMENGRLSYSQKFSFGQHAKWKAAELGISCRPPFNHSLFTIRSDGTLWEWPWVPGSYFTPRPPTGGENPIQLGNHSDWLALFPSCPRGTWNDGPALALAADGSLWAWDQPSDRIWLAPSRRPAYMGNIFQASPANP